MESLPGQDLNLANVTEPGMQDPKDPGLNKAIFRKQFKKTQMCRFFQRSSCRKGEYCEFAHGPEELAQPPDLRRTETSGLHQIRHLFARLSWRAVAQSLQRHAGLPMESLCFAAHQVLTNGWQQKIQRQKSWPHFSSAWPTVHGKQSDCQCPYSFQLLHKFCCENEVMSAAHGLEATSSEEAQQLHNILRQQQREQEEMRQVIEEQRRKINELKLQQERLQQAQLASLQPFQPQFQQPNFEAQAPEQPSGSGPQYSCDPGRPSSSAVDIWTSVLPVWLP
eukprot:g17440.t1